MTRKFLFGLLLVLIFVGCSSKEESGVSSTTGDRTNNGGRLRLSMEGKVMNDPFFVAQFTPRGDLFVKDNLQLYNYDLGSDKYPRLLISIDSEESDLNKWEGNIYPMDVFALTLQQGTKPFTSRGQIKITRVTAQFIEGQVTGELTSESGEKTIVIQGEFKAMLRLNV
jgi:hypothetical protein